MSQLNLLKTFSVISVISISIYPTKCFVGLFEREFEIIGEAMNKLEGLDPSIRISSKKQIISMRNRVIHGYDKIDDEIIWGVIIKHLPLLKSEVSDLLN